VSFSQNHVSFIDLGKEDVGEVNGPDAIVGFLESDV